MKTYLLLIFSMFFVGCSSFKNALSESKKTTEVTFKQDVVITQDSKKQNVKAGEVYKVDATKVAYVEAKGRTPIVLVPTEAKKSELKINLPEMSFSHISEDAKAEVGDHVSRILQGVNQVQQLIATGKSKEALAEATRLTKTYPHVGYLQVLKASCYLSMGDKQNAVKILEVISKQYPNDVSLQSSYNNLKNRLRE